MKQLGNLAIICAKRRKDTIMAIKDGTVSIAIASVPDKAVFSANWDDDEKISKIIYALNFGTYSRQARPFNGNGRKPAK